MGSEMCIRDSVESDGKAESLKDLMKCDLFDVVVTYSGKHSWLRSSNSTHNNVLFLDDEGLLKDNRYFSLMDTPYGGVPYAGRAVIITEDEDQKMIDSDLDLELLKERITWHPEGFEVEPMMEFIPL